MIQLDQPNVTSICKVLIIEAVKDLPNSSAPEKPLGLTKFMTQDKQEHVYFSNTNSVFGKEGDIVEVIVRTQENVNPKTGNHYYTIVAAPADFFLAA